MIARKLGQNSDFNLFFLFFQRFNSGLNSTNQSIPIKKLKKAGWTNGLRLELYTG